jgi:gliding motility-associated-like protein
MPPNGLFTDMIGRKKIQFLLSLVLIFNSGILYSQSAYVNTEEGIFKLKNGPGSSELIPVGTDIVTDKNILSIAVYKDTVYYNTWAGELKRFKPGVPGSLETLIEEGGSAYISMTVDKNGIIYMSSSFLTRYNPHTKELTELGKMPFVSAGDMLFYKDKLLLSGWNPEDWKTGIYEIDPDNLSASKLYMQAPPFLGLLSFAVPCGVTRYYGSSNGQNFTDLTEIDLADKRIIGYAGNIPENVLDAASNTESGMDNKVVITGITKTNTSNCMGNNGGISISAFSFNNPLTYTLVDQGKNQSSGMFSGLNGDTYRIRVTDAGGCSTDTSIMIAQNSPIGICNDIFIPNAFTPNNDGKNDVFAILSSTGFKDMSIQVFNRWGSIVHQSKNSNMGWDGMYKGAQQPAGVYIYAISYTDGLGEKKSLKGTLTLIR